LFAKLYVVLVYTAAWEPGGNLVLHVPRFRLHTYGCTCTAHYFTYYARQSRWNGEQLNFHGNVTST